MYTPLHYQISEYDCVPTALINGISYLYPRKEVPPMVIRHIFLYCLDTVGRNSRFGIGGTSKYAVQLVGNWLNSYKMKSFSVQTEFFEGEAVNFNQNNAIGSCLEQGGVALCNILLTKREEHYVMVTQIDSDWVYCFDSYKRSHVRGMKKNVIVLESADGRRPNLKIKKEWFEQSENKKVLPRPGKLKGKSFDDQEMIDPCPATSF